MPFVAIAILGIDRPVTFSRQLAHYTYYLHVYIPHYVI